jgi:hypothetical protein
MNDESLTPVTTFAPGELVVVDTRDAQFGQITTVGVVRYRHEGVERTGAPAGYYSVVLMVPNPNQSHLVDPMRGFHYWDLEPREMRATGHCARVEFPPQNAVGGRMIFMPDNEPKVIDEQAAHGHRRIVG